MHHGTNRYEGRAIGCRSTRALAQEPTMHTPQDPIARRRLFKTAGAAGALVAVAAAVPLVRREPEADAAAKPAPQGSAGYRATEHVLRYYETTRT
jgi:hypothetical protein